VNSLTPYSLRRIALAESTKRFIRPLYLNPEPKNKDGKGRRIFLSPDGVTQPPCAQSFNGNGGRTFICSSFPVRPRGLAVARPLACYEARNFEASALNRIADFT
jgi:hypothetical protein